MPSSSMSLLQELLRTVRQLLETAGPGVLDDPLSHPPLMRCLRQVLDHQLSPAFLDHLRRSGELSGMQVRTLDRWLQALAAVELPTSAGGHALLSGLIAGHLGHAQDFFRQPQAVQHLERLFQETLLHALDFPEAFLTLRVLPFLHAPTALCLSAQERRGQLERIQRSAEPLAEPLSDLDERDLGCAVFFAHLRWRTTPTAAQWQRMQTFLLGARESMPAPAMLHDWEEHLAQIPHWPDSVFATLPGTLNGTLVRALQAHLEIEYLHSPHCDTSIVQAAYERLPSGQVHIQPMADTGPLMTVEVPEAWAMAEGEAGLQEAIAYAYDLADTSESASSPTAPDPWSLRGDHPAWQRALPGSRRIH